MAFTSPPSIATSLENGLKMHIYALNVYSLAREAQQQQNDLEGQRSQTSDKNF